MKTTTEKKKIVMFDLRFFTEIQVKAVKEWLNDDSILLLTVFPVNSTQMIKTKQI